MYPVKLSPLYKLLVLLLVNSIFLYVSFSVGRKISISFLHFFFGIVPLIVLGYQFIAQRFKAS